MARAFDSWRALSLSLYMVLTGYAVLVGIPVVSAAWVGKLGFTEAQVGQLAAADLGGLSLGAVLCAWVLPKVNRRHVVLGAAALAVGANLACMATQDFGPVLALRASAGVASGAYTAIAVAALGATSRPERTYAWVLFAFALAQALELSLLPMLSMNGIYLALALGFTGALPFFRWMPSHAEPQPDSQAAHPALPKWVPWLVMAAVLFSYVNIGTYWTYIELAAQDAALPSGWIRGVLIGASAASLLGCLVSTTLSRRLGLGRAIRWTLAAQAAVVLLLVGGLQTGRFLASVSAFSALWMLSDIFQLSGIARIDASGRLAALIPGAQGLGQILGPSSAAALLGSGAGYRGVFALAAAASGVALALHLFLHWTRAADRALATDDLS